MDPHRNYFDDCSNCFCNVFLSYLIKKEYLRGTLFAYLSLSNDNITDNSEKINTPDENNFNRFIDTDYLK